MAVKAGDLQNRSESGESIRGESQVAADIRRIRGDRLATLEQRIAEARALRPPRSIDDWASWGAGRDAAIQAIAGD